MNRDLDPVAVESHLRRAVVELGIRHTADWRVSEADAARLLDIAPLTLRYWRQVKRGPRYSRIPIGAGTRHSYLLFDLADFIVKSRTNDPE